MGQKLVLIVMLVRIRSDRLRQDDEPSGIDEASQQDVEAAQSIDPMRPVESGRSRV